jgi:hypothetical protein
MTAQVLAEVMAGAYEGEKILLATLDIAGEEYHAGGGKGIDELRAAILSGILTGTAIKAACAVHEKYHNLHMLTGSDTYDARRDFQPEHVAALLDAASEEFTVFIIDVGANIQAPLALGALSHSNYNILVTTQQEHALGRYLRGKNKLLGPLNIVFSYLLVNKYVSVSALDGLGRLKDRYGIMDGAVLPYSDFGWQAEKERESLLCYGDKAFGRAAGAVLANMAALCGLAPPAVKRGIFAGRAARRAIDG